jgi:AraC-like DNA-binding protein
VARVAFFSIPTDMTMVAVAVADLLPPIWGGTPMESGEIITVGAGHATHSRSAACSRWGTLLLPTRVLNNHARALTGAPLQIPADVSIWHPSAAAYRNLVGLHRRATAVANVRAGVLMTPEAARSLEQELMDAVITCLDFTQPQTHAHLNAGQADLMARFEDLLRTQPIRAWRVAAFAGLLEVSVRNLRVCCIPRLGMSAGSYIRLRRLELARRALRRAGATRAGVAEIAAEYGFADAHRFAEIYLQIFGEMPSPTLRSVATQ